MLTIATGLIKSIAQRSPPAGPTTTAPRQGKPSEIRDYTQLDLWQQDGTFRFIFPMPQYSWRSL